MEDISGGDEGTHARWFEHRHSASLRSHLQSRPVPYLTGEEEEEEKEAEEMCR